MPDVRGLPILLAAFLTAPLLLAAGPAPGYDLPPGARAHLTPPEPDRGSWPAYATQGPVLLPPTPAATTGTVHVLVLLIEFSNLAHDPLHEAPYFEGTLNDPTAGSLRAYYEEVSLGALTVNATIVPTWWSSARTMEYYGQDSGSGVDDANGPVYGIVVEAVRAADPSVDFSAFDGNADGVVDHLLVLHAGDGQESNDALTDRIWSHRWAVLDADPSASGTQVLLVDGVQVYDYTLAAESSPLGVVAHEFGHGLGLLDLYDTDGSSEGAGFWDLMSGGSWNGLPRGTSPAHLSAWSRLRLGWITAETVTSALVAASIPAIETSGRAFRLPIPGASSREYFLVENRQGIGFDAGLPGTGLLIWHVDESRPTNDVEEHRLLDLEEADETFSGDRPIQSTDPWRDTSTGFGPETVPNSRAYSGAATGWRVRDISASGPTMTATIAREVGVDLTVAGIRVPDLVSVNATVDARVLVRNEGMSTEDVDLRVRVYRDVHEDAGLVLDRNLSRAALDPGSEESFSVPFNATPAGRFLLEAALRLASDEIPSNNVRYAHVLADTVRHRDDLESGIANWTMDPGQGDDPHRWALVNETDPDGAAHSPTRAWRFGFVATPAPDPAPPRWHALVSPPIPIPAGPAHLVFYHRYDLWGRTERPPQVNASETDHAYVDIRLDGGPWRTLAHFVARDLSWRGVDLDLSGNLSGPSVLQVRFNVSSDLMPEDGGWWIDDLRVTTRGLGRAVVIYEPPEPAVGPDGGSVPLELKVANLGDWEDEIELFAILLPRWNATVDADGASRPLDGTRVLLAPDQDATLRVLLASPSGSASETPYAFPFTARSVADPGASDTASISVRIVSTTPPAPDPAVLGLLGLLVAAVLLGAILLSRRRPRT